MFPCRRPVHTRWGYGIIGRVIAHRELCRVHWEGGNPDKLQDSFRYRRKTVYWNQGWTLRRQRPPTVVAVGKAHDRLARTCYGLFCHFFSRVLVTSVNEALQLSYSNDGYNRSKLVVERWTGQWYHVMMGIYKANLIINFELAVNHWVFEAKYTVICTALWRSGIITITCTLQKYIATIRIKYVSFIWFVIQADWLHIFRCFYMIYILIKFLYLLTMTSLSNLT